MLSLTRRDMVLFGIGAGTVVLGALAGLGVAAYLGVFGKKDEQDEGED
jgi:hypothetical protein